MRRRTRFFVAALMIALLAASCGDDGAENTSEAEAPSTTTESETESEKEQALAELIEKANAEGALNLDLFVVDQEAREQVEAFQALYPEIKVTYRRNNAPPMRALEEQEISAGRDNFDVVATAGGPDLAAWEDQGRLLDISDVPSYEDLPEDWRVSKTRVGFYLGMGGVFYNTQALQGEPPSTLEDVLSEEYKGKIGLADPLGASSQGMFVSLNERVLGGAPEENLEFFAKLGSMQPKLFKSTTDSSQSLGSGEIWISFNMPLSVASDLKSKGAPVALAPMEGMPYFLAETAVYAKAKHPNAAKLWTEFLIGSAEGDQVLRNNSKISALAVNESDWGQLDPLLQGVDASMLVTMKPEEIDTARVQEIAKAYGF